MQAEIISIGDELLIGQTINTNASWLGAELALRGVSVKWGVTIADEKQAILQAFDTALKRSDLVIVTGGLGPTKDDITKHTLCEYFDTTLEINPEVLARIEKIFQHRGKPMLELNIQQAALPKSCEVLHNHHGTASGMWFEKNGSVLVSLPGVPYEMKGIMNDEVFHRLQERYQVSSIYHQTILTTGIGESLLAEKMEDWENRIRAAGLGLAYLPSPGMVKLRVSSPRGAADAALIESYLEEITLKLPYHVYGREQDQLSSVVGAILREKGLTVGTVESCTGGGLAEAFVEIPGASDYFTGSFVTYSNALKQKLSGVHAETLEAHGAVSEETVKEMSTGGLAQLGVDYCISTSGIAGPDGGTAEKPVGMVWISVASKEKVVAKQFNFGNNRERNIQMTIFAALNLLRSVLLNIYTEKKL